MVTTATAFISVSMTKGTMKSDEPWYRSVPEGFVSNARFKVIPRCPGKKRDEKRISISSNRANSRFN